MPATPLRAPGGKTCLRQRRQRSMSSRPVNLVEASALRDCVKNCGRRGEWMVAAETFADYWGGANTWRDTPPERRAAFAEALKPNFFEWDAVMAETVPAAEWAEVLPRDTLLVCDPQTVLPIREIDAILREAGPHWAHAEVPGAGHMAPLTRPEVINPIVVGFLEGGR